VSEFGVKAKFGSPESAFYRADPVRDAFARVQQAEQLRQQGQLDRAHAICDALVRDHPDYMAALHTLGLVHLDKGDYQRALDCLVRAAMHDPENWGTLTALSAVYLRLNAAEMAAQTLERARAANPENVSVLLTLGEIYTEEREYELAREAFRRALALEGDLEPAAMGLAAACSDLGESAEAAQVLEGMIERGQRSLDVLVALANLPAGVVQVDLLSELDKVAGDDKGYDKAEFESFAAFVRATALDRVGRTAEAWAHLLPANRALFLATHEQLREATERERANLARLRDRPARATIDAGPGGPPISLFILGPSRSGKTTMEQLVSTLEGVKRGYENPSVDNAVRRAFQTAALLVGRFENLPGEFYPLCYSFYRKEIARRAGSARLFTNTNPGRVHDAALMAVAFPNTRFILLKRNIEDNALRIFMRRYARDNIYSYDLKAARDHVLWYHQMIDLLVQKLPPHIVRVIHYEDMVADPAGALRTAADLCGLPMPQRPLPQAGDDRGCAEPYRELMASELDP
jgi:tetratricopeptide (TPR) repeat protein